MSGPAITEGEQEVVTHEEERPVVSTETEPKARVQLAAETVTEEQIVGGDAGEERVEATPRPMSGTPLNRSTETGPRASPPVDAQAAVAVRAA
jgi:hypothetical protein